MKLEDVKVGMKVKANELSDSLYEYTTKKLGCVGEVTVIHPYSIDIKVIEHAYSYEIGSTYHVRAEAFDNAEEVLKINLKHSESDINIHLGDLVVLENGDCYLIGRRYDHFRAFNLKESLLTEHYYSLDSLKTEIESVSDSKVVRVIPSSNIEINER